jgi:hypothetical protein
LPPRGHEPPFSTPYARDEPGRVAVPRPSSLATRRTALPCCFFFQPTTSPEGGRRDRPARPTLKPLGTHPRSLHPRACPPDVLSPIRALTHPPFEPASKSPGSTSAPVTKRTQSSHPRFPETDRGRSTELLNMQRETVPPFSRPGRTGWRTRRRTPRAPDGAPGGAPPAHRMAHQAAYRLHLGGLDRSASATITPASRRETNPIEATPFHGANPFQSTQLVVFQQKSPGATLDCCAHRTGPPRRRG